MKCFVLKFAISGKDAINQLPYFCASEHKKMLVSLPVIKTRISKKVLRNLLNLYYLLISSCQFLNTDKGDMTRLG